ncbi:MAG: hypothetical protein U1F37_08825 [Alphaproteobacteria bacterium]
MGFVSRRFLELPARTGPESAGLVDVAPPKRSVDLKQKLEPKVWFHGSQSQSTGGRSARNGQA